jgi:hypothetical protein
MNRSNRNDKRRYTHTKYRRLHGVEWKITEQKERNIFVRIYEQKIDGAWKLRLSTREVR